MIVYFIIISVVAASVFAADKKAAGKGRWRVPEKVLHLLEFLGGVFIVIPMMYIIRHKNRKFSYFVWTYLILLLWIGALAYIISRTQVIDIPPEW